ncbi:molybdopterin molybdotransferase MoeA [Halovulum dunhuangense]|uniref:Molybdopterin molybdenumtransferase n=1 Tax=Halovulum dunhuangense TaxID=1505036 RepID=A0A849L6Z8_9RHOB|nr:gephyrin-like molybdotransferase Glp [Halovulum dunhuangense]NNU82023.1 molybdopterin molybdotransferase MoeA [Halovulum dunhuangense]
MTVLQRIEAQGCDCDAAGHRAGLISLEEALARIETHVSPVPGTGAVPLLGAAGRVLAEPVRANTMTPPFDNSAMDGYAVSTAAFAGDGPWSFAVASRVPAGTAPVAMVGTSRVARIFTGAPLPAGADAVIAQEAAHLSHDRVSFDRCPPRGLNIRRAGEDMMPGQVILAPGVRLGPREIAACAAAGVGTVAVRRRLRVALLVTGDEIACAESGRDDAQIWDVNTPMLMAAMRDPQVEVVRLERIPDRRDALMQGLARRIGRVDVIVTTGGVSVGEEDHVKPALRALGGEIHFSGVAMKPGKPVSFGRVGATPWLGLPGNPLSALVTWQLFGGALLRRLTGQTPPRARRLVVTAVPVRRRPGRCELRPATLVGCDALGREVVRFGDATHSARVGSLAAADGLVLLPADRDVLPTGALVEFHPFSNA